MQMEFRFSGRQTCDLDILPFNTAGPAGAECLECGFLRGKSRGVVNFRLRAFLPVLNFSFCIYSMKETIAEALNGIADSLILHDVDADAGDHDFFMLQVNACAQA